MTSPPSRPGAGFPVQPSPRNGLERNWKWAVPVGVVAGVLVLTLFIGGIFWGVTSMMRASYPYQLAVRRVTESPAVAAKLGTPLHIGWLVSGNVNFSGPEGNASISIPVSGPNGRGDIIVVGKKHANRWDFETLEVDVKGEDEPIQLMEPDLKPQPPSPETSPSRTGNST
jgi:Cytochrome oxidase complex assembly protein 1